MFGPKMHVELDGISVTLKPHNFKEMEHFSNLLESIDAKMWTNMRYASSKQEQEERFENIRKDKTIVSWAIYPEGSDVMIGVTALHDILSLDGFAVSGIIMPDKKWWNRGIAKRAHLARTLYAADILNRVTLQSSVRCINIASLKALEGVGYINTGRELRNCYRLGKYWDTYTLSWIHPERIDLLYPEGLPSEYTFGVEKARSALNLARKKVVYA